MGEKGEAARLVETLALASVGKSTQKLYLAKLNTWVGEKAAQGKGPWLHVQEAGEGAGSVSAALAKTG